MRVTANAYNWKILGKLKLCEDCENVMPSRSTQRIIGYKEARSQERDFTLTLVQLKVRALEDLSSGPWSLMNAQTIAAVNS